MDITNFDVKSLRIAFESALGALEPIQHNEFDLSDVQCFFDRLSEFDALIDDLFESITICEDLLTEQDDAGDKGGRESVSEFGKPKKRITLL